MPSLPSELLSLIFSFLTKRDLLQCQLASKSCYEASVETLYSNIKIITGAEARLYGRTISNSSRLGGYLKEIRIANLSTTFITEEPYVETDLIDAVTQNCPNLLKIRSDIQSYSFWYHITSGHSQLSRLESLPFPRYGNLVNYSFVTQLFKQTLTKLALFYNFDNDLLNIDYEEEDFQSLLNKLKEFQNLQSISIHNESEKQIGCYDNWIEACPRLKEVLFFHTFTGTRPVRVDPETIIRPRPDIHTLECYWELINNASQLRYVMKKFPDLQSLAVTHHRSRKIKESIQGKCPQYVLVNFIRYAAALPKLKIDLELNMLNLANVWVNLVGTKGRYRKVNINYKQSVDHSDIMRINADTNKLILNFPVTKDDIELPHIKFISEAGNMIQSLSIGDLFCYSHHTKNAFPPYDQLNNVNWILDIIKSCPSLKDIRLCIRDDMILPSSSSYQHTGLRKLSFTGIHLATDCINLFRFASFTFPNIKQLHLSYIWHEALTSVPIVLDMSYSCLDIITWLNQSIFRANVNTFETCIKLKTDLGTRFYIGNENSMLSTTEEKYQRSLNILRFDITCRSLSEFRIIKKDSSSIKLSWVF
ncbi:hypothetical protein BD770DRAFT_441178 [Pilaira anomala]|nr:hypothetical protein BD770DRAFT_441178 [Pilaira anomala]